MQTSTISIALTLVLILTAVGCGPPATPDDFRVIDLLDLLPPDLAMDFVGTRAPRMVWNFDRGLPEGWTAGPEGVKVELRSGGLRLESADGSPPWVEKQVTVDLLHYQQLLAVLDPDQGQPAIMLYTSADPPGYRPSNRIRVESDPDRGQQIMAFRLPAPEALAKPIEALRLYPGTGRRSSVLKRLAIIPRQDEFLARHVLSRSRIGLEHQYRRCWRLAGTADRTVTLCLPEQQAQLSFALGTLRGRSPAELTVELFRGETLLAELSQHSLPLPGSGWQEVQVDLSSWSGQEVSLRFSIRDSSPGAIRLIGTPEVRGGDGPPRPSVLLVVLDAQRADRLSLYGHHRRTSPHLARLAGEGMLFSATTAPCSWTIPSVASTFTGRHPGPEQLARGHGGRLTDHTTLAQRFSDAGYTTGGFSANCLLTSNKGFPRGFHTWYVAPHLDGPPTAGDLNRKVLRWLRAHRGEQTFCYIHYMDPHAPYNAPWPGPPPDIRASSDPWIRPGWGEGFLRSLQSGVERPGPAGVEHVGRLYDRGSEYTDFQLGRLLAVLRREGLLEGTALLVTADHGDELHDHGYWGHGSTLYQEVLHVPLILRLPEPGPEAGSVVHTPVSLVDVAPTLSAIAGLPANPDRGDGRNICRFDDARTLFSFTSAHAPLRFSVIRPPWKYIYFNRKAFDGEVPQTAQGRWLMSHGPPAEQLFNIEDDPGERKDLMGTVPEVEAEMRGRMEAWFAEAGSDLLNSVPQNSEVLDEQELERLRALGYVQ